MGSLYLFFRAVTHGLVTNRHISISQLSSLTSSHYDVIRESRVSRYGAHSPRSDYDVILIMTSLVTELATPTFTDVWTPYRLRLTYKDAYV